MLIHYPMRRKKYDIPVNIHFKDKSENSRDKTDKNLESIQNRLYLHIPFYP